MFTAPVPQPQILQVGIIMRFSGASHDLERLITTHLFVICPNNSGSTFLKNVLATSRRTWNLKREGQNTFGFAGPSTRKLGRGELGLNLLWASQQHWLNIFTRAEDYNWPMIRKAWYFQAFSQDPEACIFVEKSPPFLLNVDLLVRHFPNPKFLFMVRDPYAAVEGASRGQRRRSLPSGVDLLTAAASHIVTCLHYQQHNIETYGDRGVFFTYEEMCDEPQRVTRLIQTLVPELDDLVLRQCVPAKKKYNEMLRNMNAEQIARLSADELRRINHVFEQHQDVFDYFKYPLRS